jgi:hypothetical protein
MQHRRWTAVFLALIPNRQESPSDKPSESHFPDGPRASCSGLSCSSADEPEPATTSPFYQFIDNNLYLRISPQQTLTELLSPPPGHVQLVVVMHSASDNVTSPSPNPDWARGARMEFRSPRGCRTRSPEGDGGRQTSWTVVPLVNRNAVNQPVLDIVQTIVHGRICDPVITVKSLGQAIWLLPPAKATRDKKRDLSFRNGACQRNGTVPLSAGSISPDHHPAQTRAAGFPLLEKPRHAYQVGNGRRSVQAC